MRDAISPSPTKGVARGSEGDILRCKSAPTNQPDPATANANFSVNGGQNNVATVPFVAQDGKWKLQKQWACTGLQNLNQTSPACS